MSNSERWPLRYRVAKRAHHVVNRIHNNTGQHRLTWWLNCKAGALWIDWWINGYRNHPPNPTKDQP